MTIRYHILTRSYSGSGVNDFVTPKWQMMEQEEEAWVPLCSHLLVPFYTYSWSKSFYFKNSLNSYRDVKNYSCMFDLSRYRGCQPTPFSPCLPISPFWKYWQRLSKVSWNNFTQLCIVILLNYYKLRWWRNSTFVYTEKQNLATVRELFRHPAGMAHPWEWWMRKHIRSICQK